MSDKQQVKRILGSDVTMTLGENMIYIQCPYTQKNACAVYDYAYKFPEVLIADFCHVHGNQRNGIKIHCNAVSLDRTADYIEEFCKDCIAKSKTREQFREHLSKQRTR